MNVNNSRQPTVANSFPRTRRKPSHSPTNFERNVVGVSIVGMFAVLGWITLDSALIKMTETDCLAGRQAACAELQRRAK